MLHIGFSIIIWGGGSDDELEHYGVLGMKWGVRNYQNEDGSLTDKGKARLSKIKKSKSDSKFMSNKELKEIYESIDTGSRNYAEYVVNAYKYYSDDPETAEKITGYKLSSIPESIKDMEPLWAEGFKQSAQALYGDLDDEQKAMIVAYIALVDAGLGDYFDVGIKDLHGKRSVYFSHKNTGYICNTISKAKQYMNTVGRKTREKNVQGKPVSAKVDKSKSVSSKPVGYR